MNAGDIERVQGIANRIEELLRAMGDGDDGDRFSDAMLVLQIVQTRQFLHCSDEPAAIMAAVRMVATNMLALSHPHVRDGLMAGSSPV